MNAIEKGVVTKTTQSRLLELEHEKDEIQDKLAVEKSRQIKPLQVDEVKAFLNMYAKKQYNEDEEKKEFFNKFINRDTPKMTATPFGYNLTTTRRRQRLTI